MQLIASSLVSYVRLRETHVKDSTIIFSMRANISDLKANEESLKGAIRIAEFITAEQKAISDKEIKRLNRNTKWIKVGWASTAVFLAGTTTYFLIK